jgi:ATP-binding cassette subfamily C protein CydC
LRKVIGLVEQQPTIFVGSVRDNLLIAKPTASDDELLAVLDQVGLRETFETRDSLNTELGERGVLISGGEAQRLGLARALLADFQVLILDEPTANVDQATAMPLIRELLDAAGVQRTVLLITHDDALAEFTSRKVKISNRFD